MAYLFYLLRISLTHNLCGDVTPLNKVLSNIRYETVLQGFFVGGLFLDFLKHLHCSIMTILPKKKHSDSKKNDNASNIDNRARMRGNSSWSSSATVTERSWSTEEYSSEEQYRANSFESREAADTASSSSKRRHRSPPHRHKYHERHSEDTGYNSSDEHDTPKPDQLLSTEEV